MGDPAFNKGATSFLDAVAKERAAIEKTRDTSAISYVRLAASGALEMLQDLEKEYRFWHPEAADTGQTQTISIVDEGEAFNHTDGLDYLARITTQNWGGGWSSHIRTVWKKRCPEALEAPFTLEKIEVLLMQALYYFEGKQPRSYVSLLQLWTGHVSPAGVLNPLWNTGIAEMRELHPYTPCPEDDI